MRKLSLCYKLILYPIAIWGLIWEFWGVGALMFFTVQSNLLVLIALFLSIVSPEPSRAKAVFRGITLVAILITGVVFNFVWDSYAYGFFINITHLVIPAGFLLDWILFDGHGFLKWRDLPILLTYPLVYGGLSMLLGVTIYGFFDLSAGVGTVLMQLVLLTFLMIILGVSIVGFDKILAKRKEK